MTLEKQVCSLELAKRLKELGVKQESLFVWVYRFPYELQLRDDSRWSKARCVAAFTVAELGEMLPAGYKTTRGHDVFIVQGMPDEPHSIQRAETEADARAKMLIYLIENGLVKTP